LPLFYSKYSLAFELLRLSVSELACARGAVMLKSTINRQKHTYQDV